MKNKYTEVFYTLMEEDCFSHYLCFQFRRDRLFKLFKPTRAEKIEHENEGYSRFSWGDTKKQAMETSTFTPLRQNIVLFMAAMNEEL